MGDAGEEECCEDNNTSSEGHETDSILAKEKVSDHALSEFLQEKGVSKEVVLDADVCGDRGQS